MKLQKIITITVLAILLLSSVGFWVWIWPTDPRLHGTFRSDQEETIKRLQATRSMPAEKLAVLRQMYGHMTYSFDGHKIEAKSEHHVVLNYPRGSNTEVEQETLEAYFLLKKDRGDKACLIVFPKPYWRLREIEILDIEFDTNGFWLKSTAISANGLLEKFTKM